MCRHPTGSRHFAAELDFMLLIAPTRQMRLQLSAPYGQPPICSRIGFYAPYCSYPTDAAAVVGTLRAAATLLPSWILCSLLLLPDRCGCSCRHPTGSRQFAAELDFMLLIAPTRQMRLQLSAPCGQPPICCRVGDKKVRSFF